MRVPKYIRKALQKRAEAIDEHYKQDKIIRDWLDKHEIEVDEMHLNSGYECLCNPWSSHDAIIAAIEAEGE